MRFAPIPFVGSFQRGALFRSGDPLGGVWRQIERFGTVESLTRIATAKGHDPALAKTASLRVKQSVEFREAAREGSLLTRPLTLYYSLLNLTRAVLLVHVGEAGTSHGLKFHGRPTLVECNAEVTKKGTFPRFADSLNVPAIAGRRLSLRDLLAVIPEVLRDFGLLQCGPSSVAAVRVEAFIDGDMRLRFNIEGITEQDFQDQWATLLPWLRDVCELADGLPFTLKVRDTPKGEGNIAAFCRKHLMHDMIRREDAIWFDHIDRGGTVTLLPRLLAYLSTMFILSNVTRYEPERLAEPTRDPTDLGYLLSTFIDHTERFFPQLVLELVGGSFVFFE